MKPIIVPRKFIEECCDVFERHPLKSTTSFSIIVDDNDWYYLNRLVSTLPLNIQEYKLELRDLHPLARLYNEGVRLGWLQKKDVFDCKWADEDHKDSQVNDDITIVFRR